MNEATQTTVNILTSIVRPNTLFIWKKKSNREGSVFIVVPKPWYCLIPVSPCAALLSLPFFAVCVYFSFQENKCCLLSKHIGIGWKMSGCLPEIVWGCALRYFLLYLRCSEKKALTLLEAGRQRRHESLNLTETFMWKQSWKKHLSQGCRDAGIHVACVVEHRSRHVYSKLSLIESVDFVHAPSKNV